MWVGSMPVIHSRATIRMASEVWHKGDVMSFSSGEKFVVDSAIGGHVVAHRFTWRDAVAQWFKKVTRKVRKRGRS